MGALSDIQAILAYDNLDNPISGFKAQLEAWKTELMTVTVGPKYSGRFNGGSVQNSFPASTTGDDSSEGFKDTITTLPFLVAALGTVVGLGLGDLLFTVVDFPINEDDDFNLDGLLTITGLAGVDIATATIFAAIGTGDGGDLTLDWNSATTGISAGTDLTWTDGSLISTAGGVFVGNLVIEGGWD